VLTANADRSAQTKKRAIGAPDHGYTGKATGFRISCDFLSKYRTLSAAPPEPAVEWVVHFEGPSTVGLVAGHFANGW
jgi:hypothetical protein